MLKNVFKGKKKDKKTKDKVKKSGSMDDYNMRKEKKYKDKNKRSQTNSHDLENISHSKKKKKKTSSSSSSKKKKKSSSINKVILFDLNDYISLKDKRKGLIRYIGNVHFAPGQWLGIELIDGSIGNHDGKIGNKRYFKTASKHAIFVTHDKIKKVLKKNRINVNMATMRNSKSSSNHKKKKKEKSSNSNSYKKSNENKKKQKTERPRPNRPNSAKGYDEFFNENQPIIHQKRSVPPPPPLNQPNNLNYSHSRNSHSHSNSHSKSHSNSHHSYHSHSHQSSHGHITEHFNSMDSNISLNSNKLDLPSNIPVYSLQNTNDSNISTELSAVNDENCIDDEKHDISSPIYKTLKSKQYPKKQKLMTHRSYTNMPSNPHRKQIKNAIRKNKSYGDQLNNNNDDNTEYGLSLKDYYTHFDLNDPAIQKLKYLQKSIRRTKQSSADLEELLQATPPSLPPTPKLDLLQLQKSKSNSLSFNKYNNNKYNHYNDEEKQIKQHQCNNQTVIIKHNINTINIDHISPSQDDVSTDNERYESYHHYHDNTNNINNNSDVVAFAFPHPSSFQYYHNIDNLNNNNNKQSKSTPTTPTPNKYNKYNNLILSDPNNVNGTNLNQNGNENTASSRFQFGRERSQSDSSSKYNKIKYKKKKGKNQNMVSNNNVNIQELQSEAEDTDIEDMYKEYPPSQTAGGPMDDTITAGQPINNQSNHMDDDDDGKDDRKQSPSIAISRPTSLERHSHDEHKEFNQIISQQQQQQQQQQNEVQAYLDQNFPVDNDRKHREYNKNSNKRRAKKYKKKEYERNTDKYVSDESVVSNIITPRAVGTDAFSRIRSRSIQNKLAKQKQNRYPGAGGSISAVSENKEMEEMKEMNNNNNNNNKMMMIERIESIKTARDVCPFWNPFEENPHCPYQAISNMGGNGECTLKHLTKSQYLDRLNEDDTIELLTLLFCDSLFVESCVVIEKLLEINPSNDEYNTCMGDILEELGRYGDAERYYKIALSINPMYDDAHNNYAMMLHHKLNRVNEAEKEYKKCLAINENHQVCHTNYAKLLQHTSRYKEAEKHFKKCLKLNEENVNCQHYFGVFLYEMGRWSESKYHLKKAIELTAGSNPSYHYNLAKLLCDLKEFNEADEHFKHCLRLEPENAAFNFEFALFLAFDLKDIKQSIKYFVKAYTLDPHNSLIQKKYDEIGKIVQEIGLSKVKRRRSSARFGGTKRDKTNGKKTKHTIVEYKEDDDHFDTLHSNPCQAEFARFLSDNFSFGNCMNIYLKKFKDSELNDIRYIVAIDIDTLITSISMNKVHAKIFMNKIEKFKHDNNKFNEWLTSIALQEYYEIFEQNGILTMESFYFHIQSNADLIHILGDKNTFDVHLLWKSCPKYIRQNSMSSIISIDTDNDGNGNGDGDDIQHQTGNTPSQIEGKRKSIK